MKKNVRLKDIAEKAKVSVATVSGVLNNKLKVKPETENLIRQLILELNYEKSRKEKPYEKDKSSVTKLLLQNVRIRSNVDLSYKFDYSPIVWKRDIKKLETSLLWSPSDLTAKVAFFISSLTHPYWIHQWAILQKSRDKYYPNIYLELFDAQFSSKRMVDNIKFAIEKKFSAFIIVNHLGIDTYPGYQAANDADIPIIFFTTGAPSDVYSMPRGDYKYTTLIKTDEVAMGEKIGEYISVILNGKGNIVIIGGMEESTDNLCRRVGLQNELEFWPEIKIVSEVQADWRADIAYKLMKDILKSNPGPQSINAAISLADEQCVGVVEAIKEMKRRNEIIIASFDGSMPGLEMIKNRDIDVTIRYESEMEGVLVLDSVVKTLKGEKIPIFRRLQTHLVTKYNYKQFLDKTDTVIWETTPERDLPWERIEKYIDR